MKTKRFEVQTTWHRYMMPEVKPGIESETEALAEFDRQVAARKVRGDALIRGEPFGPLYVALWTRKRRIRRGREHWDLGECVKEWRAA